MTQPSPARHNVLGVGVSAVDYELAVECLLGAARSQTPFAGSALAVHAIMEARADESYRRRLNALDLATPDGQPVRWALNGLYGLGLRDRVYGPFLMQRLCTRAALEGLPVFLFGGTDDLLGRLSAALRRDYPGLAIAGMQASRFRRITSEEAAGDAARIQASGARLVFCGLGCPRQEAWVQAMRPLIRAPLLGGGAAFALAAGDRPMAPAWMQRRGLEWLFRLSQEPGRLSGRYLVRSPAFPFLVLRQRLGGAVPGCDPTETSPEYWG